MVCCVWAKVDWYDRQIKNDALNPIETLTETIEFMESKGWEMFVSSDAPYIDCVCLECRQSGSVPEIIKRKDEETRKQMNKQYLSRLKRKVKK